jgi:hypothetical protein
MAAQRRRAAGEQRPAKKQVLAAGMGLDEVDSALCKALTDVLSGALEPNIATAASTVGKAIVAIRAAGDLERRLSELELRAGVTKRDTA